MTVNNEIGVIQSIKEIGSICRDRNIFFMTDATQALGKIPLNVQEMKIDLLACSAHKIYGPKGVGFLFCRHSMPHVQLIPIFDGGGHERGLRSGTLNVPGIVGFAKAVDLAMKAMKTEQKRIRKLSQRLYNVLIKDIPDLKVNGHTENRMAGNLNVCIPGINSEALIIALTDFVALSTGSACTTTNIEPSHVLKALGLTDNEIHSSIRISIGRPTTEKEVDCVGKAIISEVKRLRSFHSS